MTLRDLLDAVTVQRTVILELYNGKTGELLRSERYTDVPDMTTEVPGSCIYRKPCDVRYIFADANGLHIQVEVEAGK